MCPVRSFLPLLLLPFLAHAAVVPGDTVITNVSIGEIDLVVDGTHVRVQTICTASIPGTCQSYVVGSDSVFVDPKIGSKSEHPAFLYQYQSCGVVGNGCYISRVDFVDTLSWLVVGRNVTWILRFDSLEFRTEIHPETSPPSAVSVVAMKASWVVRPSAGLRRGSSPASERAARPVDVLGRPAGPGQVPGSERQGLEILGPSKVSIPGL